MIRRIKKRIRRLTCSHDLCYGRIKARMYCAECDKTINTSTAHVQTFYTFHEVTERDEIFGRTTYIIVRKCKTCHKEKWLNRKTKEVFCPKCQN